MATWYKDFTVEGSGPFPFDMLRYDSCYPVSEAQDSSKLGMYQKDRREVTLRCRGGSKEDVARAPTTGRWNSFLWGIVKVKDPVRV